MGMADQPLEHYVDARLRGGAVSRRITQRALTETRRLVRGALKRRNLLRGPPRYLGFFDFERWDADAISALSGQVFARVFSIEQVDFMRTPRAEGTPIRKLVEHNIAQEIFSLHKAAQGVDYSVFLTVRKGLQVAVDAARLIAESADRVVAATVLRWLGVDADHPLQDVHEIELPWDEEWLALFRGLNVKGRPVRFAEVSSRLDELHSAGARRARCATIARCFQDRVRALAAEDGGDAETSGTHPPEASAAELRVTLDQLDVLLPLRLSSTYLSKRAGRLTALWRYIRQCHRRGHAPQQTEIARRFEVTPPTINADLKTLRREIDAIDPNLWRRDPL